MNPVKSFSGGGGTWPSTQSEADKILGARLPRLRQTAYAILYFLHLNI